MKQESSSETSVVFPDEKRRLAFERNTEAWRMSESAGLRARIERHVEDNYVVWLIVLGLAGWSMASYDFNLLVLTIPNISKDLGLSASAVGSLVFIIYAAQFFVTLLVGRAMDDYGRLRVWQWALVGTAIFTGLTYFVSTFWQLAVVRVLASAFAQSELAISITLINEQAPTKNGDFSTPSFREDGRSVCSSPPASTDCSSATDGASSSSSVSFRS